MSRADIDVDVFKNPQSYPRDFLMEFTGGMEDVIFDGEKQVTAVVAHARTIGMDGGLLKSWSQMQQTIMLINKRAVQVWIATLGAREKQEATVKEIWRKMLSSRADLSSGDMDDPEDAVQMKLMTEDTLSFVPTKYQLA
jgi:hypothetical protein